MEGASLLENVSLLKEGMALFCFAAREAAAAEGDKRQGGADRTVDINPPQSESMFILSFDALILTLMSYKSNTRYH